MAVCIAGAFTFGSTAAQAEADNEPGIARLATPRLQVDIVPRWSPSRLPGPLPTDRLWTSNTPMTAGMSLGEGVGARLMWGRGKLSVGAGVDWLAAPSGSALQAQAAPYPLGPGADTSRSRVALEFRSKTVTRDLRESLFRVQMQGGGALNFRPRSGGLQVSYQKKFF